LNSKRKVSISLRSPCVLAISLLGTQNAFLAKSGFLPQLAANIVIFQTNAQFVGIFSSCYSLLLIRLLSGLLRSSQWREASQCAKRHNGQGIKKERVPTFLIPLDGSGKPYQKMRKSSPRPITIRCGHLPPFVPW
jgi:hypothetical protein